MAELAVHEGEFPLVRIYVETTGNLRLANVGRFLQRLDTGAKRVAQQEGWRRPTIEIVSLQTGSLELKFKVVGLRLAKASLAVASASFALQLAEYIKEEPAAARSVFILMNEDHGSSITVDGGGAVSVISPEDLATEEYRYARSDPRVAANRSPSLPEPEIGRQSGVIHRYGGGSFVELDTRPGLFIRIRDERENAELFLEDNLHYSFDGELHMPSSGPSFFIIRKAMLLS